MTKHKRPSSDGGRSTESRSVTLSKVVPVGEATAAISQPSALTINCDLIERRTFVRPIPVPLVIEGNDEASWSTWDELIAQQDPEHTKVSTVAKLLQSLRRPGHETSQS